MAMSKTDWLVRRLTSQLRSLPPGTRLPTLRDLQKQYDVSLTTMNRVIAKLKINNKIEVVHGSGIYVSETDKKEKLKTVDIIYFGADDVLNTPGYVKDLIHSFAVELGRDNIGTTVTTLPLKTSLDSSIAVLDDLDMNAVISVFLRDNSFLSYFDELKIPHITVTPDVMDVGKNSVYIDNQKILHDIFCYLIANGHRKIAYLNSRDDNIFSRDIYQRELYYYRECIGNALPVTLDLFRESGSSYKDIRKTVGELVESGSDFSALIIDDQAAIAVYDELATRKIKPGLDISIVGIDDLEKNRFLQPSLSSVFISQCEIARNACVMLKALFGNCTRSIDNVFVKPELVVRNSVVKIADSFGSIES